VMPLLAVGTARWDYPDYSWGTYVPRSGNFSESVTGGQYTCRTAFRFDDANITSIKDYNNGGDNPGSRCDNARTYVTLDQVADGDGGRDGLDADLIVSTLPNPKYDYEDDNGDGRDEESEAVALGSVTTSTQYAMRTYWNDRRKGGKEDGGVIEVAFTMSKKGFSDYNTCQPPKEDQIHNRYGKRRGDL